MTASVGNVAQDPVSGDQAQANFCLGSHLARAVCYLVMGWPFSWGMGG